METIAKEIRSKMNKANPDKNEGYVASMIEEQTARIPSDVYLWAALGAIGFGVVFSIISYSIIYS